MEIYIPSQALWVIGGALSCLSIEIASGVIIYFWQRKRQRDAMYEVPQKAHQTLQQSVNENLKKNSRLN